jgi:primosomal protein N' (replication factor Y)
VINIEAPLENTFHYHVPGDLRARIRPGHLVEVEFGRRLAQGVVLRLDDETPVEDTKPVIALVDARPVLYPWQLQLAQWLRDYYLAPLNACIRLIMPPGLTRWADFTVAIHPHWTGAGRLTALQRRIVDIVEARGDLRGRQLGYALGKAAKESGEKKPAKSTWQNAVNQLVRREILVKGTILDPPRMRPKKIRNAELVAGPRQILERANQLGRASKAADMLYALAHSRDPLPALDTILDSTGAGDKHAQQLVAEGLVTINPAVHLLIPAGDAAGVPVDVPADVPAEWQDLYRRLPAAAEDLSPMGVQALQDAGLVYTVSEPATIALAMPRPEVTEAIYRLRNGETYWRALQYLAEEARPVELTALYAATEASIYHLRRLAKAELVRLGAEEVWRDPLADRDFVPRQAPTLTQDQQQVWQVIRAELAETTGAGTNAVHRPVLLHGVTGSGKTEIYMRAIDHALERGKQAIVLVPEIALTPQTVRRFAARFPGRVAVVHSRLSDGERYDTWRRARQGDFDIVVGPRSALFTPFPDLGIIVVDEEHDNSYKQTPPVPPPYYHARETAVQLGRLTGAMVILGSATPDLVSYHAAQRGTYQLLELPQRVMGHRDRIYSQAQRLQVASKFTHETADPDETVTIPLPPVRLVDLRQELRAGNRSIFSRALQDALDEVLERGEQAILFLNRRGTKTFVMCRDCGHVLQCPRCDVPLTYHRPHLQLSCHQCGRKEPQPQACPQCGSQRIKYFGLGTEELEAQVQARWPQARTVRWDRDTTAGRDTHEHLLASFINHEADVLVGTQMIAKGLDLPLVTLVGVISADVSLGLPDMQTGERTFQVLTQVSGRAGRGLLGGRVIVQTYQPGHYAIQAAAEHDYPSFYLAEIRFRTVHGLPPFRRMARLLLRDPNNDRAQHQAHTLATALRGHIRQKALGATELLGPTPAFFSRIDGRYRWQIIVRSPDPTRLLTDFPLPRPWIVDIDPVSTL